MSTDPINIQPDDQTAIGSTSQKTPSAAQRSAIGGLGVDSPQPDLNGFDTAIKEDYTNLANQQKDAGTAALDVAGMNQDVENATDVKSGMEYVKPEGLVEDRLESMLGDENNKMNQRLQSLGTMKANRAGLASTSMGVGAAIGQAAEGLREVAARDANAINEFQGRQQTTENSIENYKGQGAVSGQLNQQEQAQKNIDSAFKIAANGLDKATTARFERMKTEWDQNFKAASQEFDSSINTLLQNKQINAKEAEDLRKYGSEIIQNHQVAVENLLGNTTFLGLGSKATKNILNNLAQGMRGSLQYLHQSSGSLNSAQNSYLSMLQNNFTFGSSYRYTTPGE